MKQFTFRQKLATGFMQQSLGYFFILNSLQEVIAHADFLFWLYQLITPQLLFRFQKSKNCIHGHGFWKFNSFLLSGQSYVRKTN